MKRTILFLVVVSFAIHAEEAAFSSQFLKLLASTEPAQTTNQIIQKAPEQPPSKPKKTKSEPKIQHDDQKNNSFLSLLVIHENANPKLYKEDLGIFNFKYINHLEYADECEGFPALDEKKLTKTEKQLVKKYGNLVAKGYEAPWYLQYINEQIGHGAFADEDIEEGQMIGEYTGTVIQRMKSKDFDFSYGWSLIAPEYHRDSVPAFFVDARKSGNFTRFINHSCYPNVSAIVIYSQEAWHMVYVASRLIKSGEQLLVNYGAGYWSHKTCQPIEIGL